MQMTIVHLSNIINLIGQMFYFDIDFAYTPNEMQPGVSLLTSFLLTNYVNSLCIQPPRFAC